MEDRRGKAAEVKETVGMDCVGQKTEGPKGHCKDWTFFGEVRAIYSADNVQ